MEQQHASVKKKYLAQEIEEGREYIISSFRKGKRNLCLVAGCDGGGKDKFCMYRHFCLRHSSSTLVITEDGRLPKCNFCGMHVHKEGMEKHVNSKTCQKGRTRRMYERKQDVHSAAENVSFLVNGVLLVRASEFVYLGRAVREDGRDTTCIVRRISKARQRWGSVAKILKREGACSKVMAKFYLAVVQAVLLYGSDSWIITDRDWKRLRSFHNCAI